MTGPTRALIRPGTDGRIVVTLGPILEALQGVEAGDCSARNGSYEHDSVSGTSHLNGQGKSNKRSKTHAINEPF